MKIKIALLICFLAISISCSEGSKDDEIAKWKSEILAMEKAFNDTAQKEGLANAFKIYAAPEGVIKRGKKVIKGKDNIFQWYANDARPGESLSWEPTFVDVSSAGDLGYTYGDYIFTSTDSTGIVKESKGIFHTVWKRQPTGEWKFVWD